MQALREPQQGPGKAFSRGPIAISFQLKHPANFRSGKLPTPFAFSTGLSFATRHLGVRGQSSAEGARVEASNLAEGTKGVECGKGSGEGAVPLPRKFWDF